MKKLLAFGFDDDKKNLIKNSAEKFEIEARFLMTDDLGNSLGYLLGHKGFAAEKEKVSKIEGLELIYFSDFDRDLLKTFLLDLKGKGLIISHKAVETKTNVNWTLYHLLRQIEKERILLIKFNKLGTLVKKGQDKLREGYNKDLEKLIEEALELRKPPLKEEVLNRIISELEKIL